MSKTIGFIGSGSISSQVARLATAAGLNVVLSNSRGPETLADVVDELGPLARAATVEEAVRDADLVVASIPFSAYRTLPVEALAGKVVIDTMNYYPERDGDMAEVATDKISTSELVQRHLVGARVVRVLNNLDWVRLHTRARAAGAADRSAVPIAGDDEDAKAAVSSFLDRIGYDAADFGPLSESWRSGPSTPVYVTPYIGTIPTDIADGEARAWFLSAPGQTVPPKLSAISPDRRSATTRCSATSARCPARPSELPHRGTCHDIPEDPRRHRRPPARAQLGGPRPSARPSPSLR